MKGSLIWFVLTALLATSVFEPHQRISAVSQNNTEQGANGCIGLECLIVFDNEADLFPYQRTAGASRMLVGGTQFIVSGSKNADRQAVDCSPGLNGRESCIGGSQYQINGRSCSNNNRVYPCRRS